MSTTTQHRLLGEPIANKDFKKTLLGVFPGLAVEAPDATSSVAYGWEAMATAALAAGLAFQWTLILTAAVVAVVVMLGIGYTYVIRFFSQGGGSYSVARSQLAVGLSLVAAASLLVDYILTVAVSDSSAVFQVTSQLTFLKPQTVSLCVLAVGFFVFLNLRGIHNLAPFLMGVLVFFLTSMYVMVVVGEIRLLTGTLHPVYSHAQVVADHPAIGALLSAFAAGAVALTGLESISNGVQIFKHDGKLSNVRRANRAMWILITVIISITLPVAQLAVYGNVHVGNISALVQISTMVYQGAPTIAGWNILGSMAPISTSLLLLMAVQTSFTSAPQLTNLLARHGFMPRQFSDRQSRMAFGWGIYMVGITSATLLVIFRGDTQALIPLYSIGVFVGFSLALFGLLVMFWRSRKTTPLWTLLVRMSICTIAFVAAFSVLVIQISEKVKEGGFVTLLLIGFLVVLMSRISYHYRSAKGALEAIPPLPDRPLVRATILLVQGIDARANALVRYARSSGVPADHIRVVHLGHDEGERQTFTKDWISHFGEDYQVRVLNDQYRDPMSRLREYVRLRHNEFDVLELVVVSTVYEGLFDVALHHRFAHALTREFVDFGNVVITKVPWEAKVKRDPFFIRWLSAIGQGPTGQTDELVEH